MRGRSQSARFLRSKRRTAAGDARRRFGKAGKGRGLSARALAVIPYTETFCREKRLLHSHSGDKFLCPSAISCPVKAWPRKPSICGLPLGQSLTEKAIRPRSSARPKNAPTRRPAPASNRGCKEPSGLCFRLLNGSPAFLQKMARAVIPFRKIPRSRSLPVLPPKIFSTGETASAPSGCKRPLRRRRPRPAIRPAHPLRSEPRSRCG